MPSAGCRGAGAARGLGGPPYERGLLPQDVDGDRGWELELALAIPSLEGGEDRVHGRGVGLFARGWFGNCDRHDAAIVGQSQVGPQQSGDASRQFSDLGAGKIGWAPQIVTLAATRRLQMRDDIDQLGLLGGFEVEQR
jgi:hypothetical protein